MEELSGKNDGELRAASQAGVNRIDTVYGIEAESAANNGLSGEYYTKYFECQRVLTGTIMEKLTKRNTNANTS